MHPLRRNGEHDHDILVLFHSFWMRKKKTFCWVHWATQGSARPRQKCLSPQMIRLQGIVSLVDATVSMNCRMESGMIIRIVFATNMEISLAES